MLNHHLLFPPFVPVSFLLLPFFELQLQIGDDKAERRMCVLFVAKKNISNGKGLCSSAWKGNGERLPPSLCVVRACVPQAREKRQLLVPVSSA
jgi:hypothetical protein